MEENFYLTGKGRTAFEKFNLNYLHKKDGGKIESCCPQSKGLLVAKKTVYKNMGPVYQVVLRPGPGMFTGPQAGMINYPKQNAYLRVQYLDAAACRVFDYVWVYNTNVGHSPKRFTTAHWSVLHATKTPYNNFYKGQVALPYQNPYDRRIQKLIQSGSPGRMPYSWWYYDMVKNVSREKTLHPCQIPCGLFTMLVNAATKENDIVFVLFGGSGSELLVCDTLKRRFISSELHKAYYEAIIKRLRTEGV